MQKPNMLGQRHTPDTSVIVSTYNSPETLEKVLWAYSVQKFTDFELVIADDGSTPETAELLHSHQGRGLTIQHVWQEDKGFRKNRILNHAIQAARGQYCVFTDGDCLPRADFVATHFRMRRKNRFLVAGSHISLPDGVHQDLTYEEIVGGHVFQADWLCQRSHFSKITRWRLSCNRWIQPILNRATHRPMVFTGNGSSAWKSDAVAINGFDERLAYGGEDRDFGIRLSHRGVRSKMCKFSLINLHLDHPRPYVDEKSIRTNYQHLKQLRHDKRSWTEYGIQTSCSKTATTKAA